MRDDSIKNAYYSMSSNGDKETEIIIS